MSRRVGLVVFVVVVVAMFVAITLSWIDILY